MYPEIIRHFSKDEPRKTGGINHGNNRVLKVSPEKTEIGNQRAKKG